ncbi:MAG: ribosome hibernation-promoting factor, HPF/YfiA family [Aestuariivirga sp.]
MRDDMQIKVTGKNIDVGDALRGRIDERLRQLRDKYFEGAVRGHVTVAKQRSKFHCECSLHLATGLQLQAEDEAADAIASFEGAAQHLEKQLKRYKQRLKNHHKNRREPVAALEAASYVIQAEGDLEEEPADLNPVIVAESGTSVPELSVGEAVMALDISRVPVVFFRNSRDGHFNVVYRRHDGNIGWIDPYPGKAG